MVGIIIPIYHSKSTICDALDSLVSQTKKFFIVFPSIDGDGEDYEDIFNEYRRRGLHINPIVSIENNGPGMARQKAIDAATMCDYLIFLDSDDMLMPKAVEILTREMNVTNSDIISSDFLVESDISITTTFHAKNTPVTWCHGKCYRRKYLIENDIRFLPQFRINEDSYFNLVAWNSTKKRMILPEVTAIWRQNKNSITRSCSGRPLYEKVIQTYPDTQTLGTLKIIENTGDIPTLLLATTLKNIYQHIMRQRFYRIKFDKYLANLKKLKYNNIVQKKFQDIEFWEYAIKVEQGEQLEENFFFYKENFQQWLLNNIINKEEIK